MATVSQRGRPLPRNQVRTGSSVITRTSARKTGATSQATARRPPRTTTAEAVPSSTTSARGSGPPVVWSPDGTGGPSPWVRTASPPTAGIGAALPAAAVRRTDRHKDREQRAGNSVSETRTIWHSSAVGYRDDPAPRWRGRHPAQAKRLYIGPWMAQSAYAVDQRLEVS